ncbi:MAG: RHS repeat-associated core domain-containing protein [Elusimicrobiota bacterium]|jgi:RHS repeat-associated protein
MIRVNRPDDTLTRTYDLSGNVIKEEDAASKLEFGYDAAGRPTAANQTNKGADLTSGITYEYDAVGNRTKMTLAANPTPLVWSYAYDSLNRQTSITNPQNKVFGFTYDAAGRMTKLSYPNGIDADASYDNAGQLLSIIDKRTADQVVVASVTYAYDNAGNRTSMTDWAGTHTYGYDDLHRLISAVHPAASNLPVLNETFAYDGVGNRTQDAVHTGYQYDVGNRVQENNAQTFTHDNNGSLTSMTDKLSGHATSYAYNSEDRQKEVTLPDGKRVVTKYDAQGRRIEKSLLESGQSTPAPENVTRYVYDAEDILAMLDGNNQVQQIFTHGPGIDEPLSLRKDDGTEYFIHADALGSVIAHTDAAGVVVERVQYQAYGKPVFLDVRGPTTVLSDHSLTGNPHAFTGRENDHETQNQHSRHRTYDYNRGAFFQEDPISFGGGDVNLFAYVANSPTNATDAFGLMGMEPPAWWDRAHGYTPPPPYTPPLSSGLGITFNFGNGIVGAQGSVACNDQGELWGRVGVGWGIGVGIAAGPMGSIGRSSGWNIAGSVSGGLGRGIFGWPVGGAMTGTYSQGGTQLTGTGGWGYGKGGWGYGGGGSVTAGYKGRIR